MRVMTFTAAVNEFFGRKPNQTLGEFQQELKALDTSDRQYFAREFLKVGIEVQLPTA